MRLDKVFPSTSLLLPYTTTSSGHHRLVAPRRKHQIKLWARSSKGIPQAPHIGIPGLARRECNVVAVENAACDAADFHESELFAYAVVCACFVCVSTGRVLIGWFGKGELLVG